MHIAHALLELGELSEATRTIEEAHAATPADDIATIASTSMVLGLVREAEGKFEEAEPLLRKGLELTESTDYNPWEYNLSLAEFLLRRGRTDEGRQYLAKAVASASPYGPASPLLAYVERRGARAAAWAQARELRTTEPMTDSQNERPTTDDCCIDPADPSAFRRVDSEADCRWRDATDATGDATPLGQLQDAEQIKPTLLELGSGSGALTVALLSLGVARADGIDLSPEGVATARRRADAAGVGDRVTFEVGDGAQVPLAKHDWVVLDRVMCCYPDVDRLLANAIPAAGSRFAFSVPNSRGWRGIVTKILIPLEFVVTTLQRIPCPAYVHSLDTIEGRLKAEGFSLRSRTIGFWYTAVWERPAPA